MTKKAIVERLDIMVDIETLGTRSNATVFQIAAVVFDLRTGKTFEEFNRLSDISQDPHVNVEGKTVLWWFKEDPILFKELLTTGRISSKELMLEFNEWLWEIGAVKDGITKDVYLWGNGAGFDNVLVRTQIAAYGGAFPFSFSKDRDVRTILELAGMKTGMSGYAFKKRLETEDRVRHDALDDAKFQALVVSKAYNLLMRN